MKRLLFNVFLLFFVLLIMSCDNPQNKAMSNEKQDVVKVETDEIVDCDWCDGDGYRFQKCSKCNGLGEIYKFVSSTGRGPCSFCNGSGRLICSTCSGSGRIKCQYCDGKRKRCTNCNGSGFTTIGTWDDVTYIKCPYCEGSGYEVCLICDNVGFLPCSTCSGTGLMKCPKCYGSGKGELQTHNSEYSTVCNECNGKGEVIMLCDKCNGTGKIKESELD